MHFSIDVRHAILMIARALDYVGVDDLDHGHRVGFIAHECAKELGWSRDRQYFILLAGLLHDCGVSSSKEHERLVSKLNPDAPSTHCEMGYRYALQSDLIRPFADIILYHHTAWPDLAALDLSDETKEHAALIYLSDRLDFLRASHIRSSHPETVILAKDSINETLKANAGTLFNPDFVDALSKVIQRDGFWFSLEHQFIEDIVLNDNRADGYQRTASLEDIEGLALIMARIVDAHSPFTRDHSELVADLACEIARKRNWASEEISHLHIAGLLHDIGKLKTPDEILHKQQRLSSEEYSMMKRHTVDTYRLLYSCFPESPIPSWAANHHERLDGSGYPYGLDESQLDEGSRIIAIADIFQALAQKRPYKDRLTFDEIMVHMKELSADHKIDQVILTMLEDHPDTFYQIAIGAQKEQA